MTHYFADRVLLDGSPVNDLRSKRQLDPCGQISSAVESFPSSVIGTCQFLIGESKIPTKNSLSILSRLQTEDLKLVGGFSPLEKY